MYSPLLELNQALTRIPPRLSLPERRRAAISEVRKLKALGAPPLGVQAPFFAEKGALLRRTFDACFVGFSAPKLTDSPGAELIQADGNRAWERISYFHARNPQYNIN